MSEIVFFLEEPSAQALLESLLPRFLPTGQIFRCIVFEGKQDLEKQIVRRIRGYLNPGARFIVLRDKDAADCHVIKKSLTDKCTVAGRPNAIVRIACHELESWYLADLAAVENGLGISGLRTKQNKRMYRAPDEYPSPSKTLSRIAPAYQKISGSRAIGKYLDIENRRSQSFAQFVSSVQNVSGALTSCDSG